MPRLLLVALMFAAFCSALPVSAGASVVADDCYYVDSQVPPYDPWVRVCPPPDSQNVYVSVGGLPPL